MLVEIVLNCRKPGQTVVVLTAAFLVLTGASAEGEAVFDLG
ncbi:hypothetical protein [Arthrobacter humicola]|nr:hypothetical protein [Arthrobacter humicola]